MGSFIVQQSFTHGEMSPRAIARNDITLYAKSAQKMRNVLAIPEGGARRRFGTKFLVDIEEQAANPIVEDQYNLFEFQFSETQNFIGVILDSEILMYDSDGAFVNSVTTPYGGSDIDSVNFAQSTNLMIFAHPDYSPRQMSYDSGLNTFSFTTIGFTFVPPHDFVPGTYDAQTFTLGATTGTSVNLTVSAGTFTFTDEFVGGYFSAAGPDVTQPIGYAQIISRTSSTVVVVDIINEFAATANKGTQVAVAAKAWSDTEADSSGNRGWPQTVTFYQDRLYFGGSRSLPQTLFGSRVGDFIDFDIGTGEADEAIVAEISSNEINDIKHLIADRSLQVFTFSSEWSPPQDADQPLEPGNISIRKQSNYGSSSVDPVLLDNATFYVKRGGKGVMSFQFNFDTSSYESTNVSIISNNLIRNPVDSAILQGSPDDDADYLFLVNDDGTVGAFQVLASQDISAWSLLDTQDHVQGHSTQANVKRAQEIGTNVVFLVERIVSGQVKRYIERADFNIYTDCSIVQTFGSPQNTITGLGKLEGALVQIRGDDYVFPPQVVIGGQVSLPDGATVSNAQVGLGFTPILQTLPVITESQDGLLNFIPKRINRFFVQYYESLGIYADDTLLPNLAFPQTLDVPSLPITGIDEVYKQDWSDAPSITITQEGPLPMTILAVGYEVTP